MIEKEKLTELVLRCKNGDGEAFDALFSVSYNDVYYYALKTVKDPDLACDVTQETFMEAFTTIKNLKEPAAFVMWIRQITYHQCTRYFKKKKEVTVEEDEDGNSIFDTLSDDPETTVPEEIYEKKEFRQTILNLVDSLSEDQRYTVMLYYFDEMSVSQIAAIQGVSEGTVKSRLNYARKALKNSVEDYEKKTGDKLHAFSAFALFRILWKDRERLSPKIALCIKDAAVKAGVSASGTSAAAAVAEKTVSAAASAAKAGGFVSKLAAVPLAAKLAAAVAAVVLIGGIIAGSIALANKNSGEAEKTEKAVTDYAELREDETGITGSETEAPETEENSTDDPVLSGPRYEIDDFKIYNYNDLTDLKDNIKDVFFVYLEYGFIAAETKNGDVYKAGVSSSAVLYPEKSTLLFEGCNAEETYVCSQGYAYKDHDGVFHLFISDGKEITCTGLRGEIVHITENCVFTFENGRLYGSWFNSSSIDVDELNLPVYFRYTYRDENAGLFGKNVDVDYYDFSKVVFNGNNCVAVSDGKVLFADYFFGKYDGQIRWGCSCHDKITEDGYFGFERTVGDYAYMKPGFPDRLFYLTSDGEKYFYLPDDHTVSEITFYNFGNVGSVRTIVFGNGDVYRGRYDKTVSNIVLTKDETLSALGKKGHILKVFDNSSYALFLMDDYHVYCVSNFRP